MKTGRLAPTHEGVANRSGADEVDHASPDHHDAEGDRKPDRDEFPYRHSLVLILLTAGIRRVITAGQAAPRRRSG